MKKLIKLLYENARYTTAELAVMLDCPEEQIEEQIAALEKDGVIRGYKAIVDWERLDKAWVTAQISLKVVPERDVGFEEIAERVMAFEEVESVHLMSGGCDLSVLVKAKTFQEVAAFVSKKLACLPHVTSTETSFVLRRYKDLGVELLDRTTDDRGRLSLC